MNFGSVLVLIGVILVALDFILWRGGSSRATYHTFGLVHLGVILIGVGVLCGPETVIHVH